LIEDADAILINWDYHLLLESGGNNGELYLRKSQRPLQWGIKRLACCVDAGKGESCRGELELEEEGTLSICWRLGIVNSKLIK
jgi:hypothetical protein